MKIKTNKMIGKVLTSPVAHAQPITGGKAPAAPPKLVAANLPNLAPLFNSFALI